MNKKIFVSALLVLVLVMSFSVTAFANPEEYEVAIAAYDDQIEYGNKIHYSFGMSTFVDNNHYTRSAYSSYGVDQAANYASCTNLMDIYSAGGDDESTIFTSNRGNGHRYRYCGRNYDNTTLGVQGKYKVY